MTHGEMMVKSGLLAPDVPGRVCPFVLVSRCTGTARTILVMPLPDHPHIVVAVVNFMCQSLLLPSTEVTLRGRDWLVATGLHCTYR